MFTKDAAANNVAAVLAAKELHTLESITDDEFEAVLVKVLANAGYEIPEETSDDSSDETAGGEG
jgi:restriction endonuclease Mrr